MWMFNLKKVKERGLLLPHKTATRGSIEPSFISCTVTPSPSKKKRKSKKRNSSYCFLFWSSTPLSQLSCMALSLMTHCHTHISLYSWLNELHYMVRRLRLVLCFLTLLCDSQWGGCIRFCVFCNFFLKFSEFAVTAFISVNTVCMFGAMSARW